MMVNQESHAYSVILFLDFDGVLHPFPDPDKPLVMVEYIPHFGLVDRLAGVLRDYPEVGIVISSSWRTFMPLAKMRLEFPPDIACRIVSITPVFEEAMEFKRQQEIEAWLVENAFEGPWAVLDDFEKFFEPGYPHLILIDTDFGITDEDMKRLRKRLEDLKSKPR